jgi:hypothetical protein
MNPFGFNWLPVYRVRYARYRTAIGRFCRGYAARKGKGAPVKTAARAPTASGSPVVR